MEIRFSQQQQIGAGYHSFGPVDFFIFTSPGRQMKKMDHRFCRPGSLGMCIKRVVYIVRVPFPVLCGGM